MGDPRDAAGALEAGVLAAVGGKIDVDVGRGELVFAQETLEEQIVRKWVDAGDA